MTLQEYYAGISSTLDAMSVRNTQLQALAKVLQDASTSPQSDDQSISDCLWLMSDLLRENTQDFEVFHKECLDFFRSQLSQDDNNR